MRPEDVSGSHSGRIVRAERRRGAPQPPPGCDSTSSTSIPPSGPRTWYAQRRPPGRRVDPHGGEEGVPPGGDAHGRRPGPGVVGGGDDDAVRGAARAEAAVVPRHPEPSTPAVDVRRREREEPEATRVPRLDVRDCLRESERGTSVDGHGGLDAVDAPEVDDHEFAARADQRERADRARDGDADGRRPGQAPVARGGDGDTVVPEDVGVGEVAAPTERARRAVVACDPVLVEGVPGSPSPPRRRSAPPR